MTLASKGMKLVAELPDDEVVVGICVFQERLYVATESHVYRTDRNGDKLLPIRFEIPADGKDTPR